MENLKELKKIDIHAHTTAHPDLFPPYQDGKRYVSAEELIAYYEQLGIEKGVLLPLVAPEGMQTQMTTSDCKMLSDRYPERFVWFCNVDPRASVNNETAPLDDMISFYKEKGAKGVGEVTARIWIDDKRVDNLFGCCEECQMPVILHISPDFERGAYGLVDDLGLYRLEKMLKKHPKLKILGHSAPFWAEISADITETTRFGYPEGKVTEGRLAKLMRECENLCCDISAFSGHNALMRDSEYAASFMDEFCDRIYYGCDICVPGQTHWFAFRDFLNNMLDTGMIRPEAYRKIVRENALKLLNL